MSWNTYLLLMCVDNPYARGWNVQNDIVNFIQSDINQGKYFKNKHSIKKDI